MRRRPILIAPFDAELFGHWWFEGHMWLEAVIRKSAENADQIQLISPSDYLKKYQKNQTGSLSFSSWGYKGYGEFWLNNTNDWIYRHMHAAEKNMIYLADCYDKIKNSKDSAKRIILRAINQAARELMLLESSDWPFILKAGVMVPYAELRIKQHVGRFIRIYNDIINDTIDLNWLKEVEKRDNIFADIKCALYYQRSTYKKCGLVLHNMLNTL